MPFRGTGSKNPQASQDRRKFKSYKRSSVTARQLLQSGFTERVQTQGIWPKKIPFKEAGWMLQSRMTRAVYIAVTEALVDMAVGVIQDLSQAGPVQTGTWVGNYVLSDTPFAVFNRWIGFYPFVVAGEPAEAAARKVAPYNADRDGPSLVSRIISSNLDRFYIMNVTPYRVIHEYYTGGIERQVLNSALNQYYFQVRQGVAYQIDKINKRSYV